LTKAIFGDSVARERNEMASNPKTVWCVLRLYSDGYTYSCDELDSLYYHQKDAVKRREYLMENIDKLPLNEDGGFEDVFIREMEIK